MPEIRSFDYNHSTQVASERISLCSPCFKSSIFISVVGLCNTQQQQQISVVDKKSFIPNMCKKLQITKCKWAN